VLQQRNPSIIDRRARAANTITWPVIQIKSVGTDDWLTNRMLDGATMHPFGERTSGATSTRCYGMPMEIEDARNAVRTRKSG